MNPNDLFLRAYANKASDPAATSTDAPGGGGGGGGDPTPEQLSLLFKLDQQHNRQQRAQRDHDQQDAQLAQLLDQMDDYKPIIPDEVTDYYLQRAGFDTNDVRVKRLVGLAAQRFISSIASDAFQYARARTAAGPDGGRTTATATAAPSTATTSAAS
ncbi:Transcription initiation factor TFIID subunit 10, partial [Rhodotorula mucilaginosa]